MIGDFNTKIGESSKNISTVAKGGRQLTKMFDKHYMKIIDEEYVQKGYGQEK